MGGDGQMGIYVNPDNIDFQRAINSQIYVDKSGLIELTNAKLFRFCEKISVNSTTVIKNDIASGLKNSRSFFYSIQ